MTIDFSNNTAVAFDMIPYINKIFTAFPEKITGVSSTPAADHLFNVRPPAEEAKLFPEEQARAFHHTVAQLLFLSRVQCDIQTTIAFLTTRVKQPNEDDWRKLKCVLKYLNGTRFLVLTLSADSISLISSGTLMHLIKPIMTAKVILALDTALLLALPTSTKYHSKAQQKARSLVYMINQATYFGRNISLKLKDIISSNIVYQDNMSTFLLAKNGYVSSSKHTKHIKAKYFFICQYHNVQELKL